MLRRQEFVGYAGRKFAEFQGYAGSSPSGVIDYAASGEFLEGLALFEILNLWVILLRRKLASGDNHGSS